MQKIGSKMLGALTIFFMLFVAVPAFGDVRGAERKIIIFEDNVSLDEQDEIIHLVGADKLKNLPLVRGTVAMIRGESARALLSDPRVKRIDDDAVVEAYGKPTTPSQPSQVTPWGIARTSAPSAWTTSTADSIKVAIVDTGIEFSHPDLSVNIKGGYNAIDPTKLPQDDNGHGTHVAGTVAAANNAIGVVGIAPNVDLYAIKVLNRRGSGFISDIIEGLDWAIQNQMDVVNMSLGSSSDVQSLHDAVARVYDAGIIQVAAAGNSGGSVGYPAAYPEVFAVSAIDQNDNIASFSSHGPEVDFAAPGVNVFSTYKGQTYATLNGTSMATPHLTGTVAMLLSLPSVCDANLDEVCSFAEIRTRLEQSVDDLGAMGRDDLYGAGVVNVARMLGM